MRLSSVARELEMAGRTGSLEASVRERLDSARAEWTAAAGGLRRLAPGSIRRVSANGTALVVDDSAVNRLVLVRRLETLGLDVIQAENGLQALDVLSAEPGRVDVVLLDVLMPELDGYETLAAMKADDETRHIPVLIVSGVDELDSVVRCIELGASDYLPKPINPSILAARINASLAAKRLHDMEQALNRTIERQKQELSRFLSPQVAALVSSPDGEQLLAGHRREITVAFCDLRGFTAFAEQADPEELMTLLSQYHRMMGEAITEHDGTLEHFAGDGVMVFFNDPIEQGDHVERCVRMAVEMRDRFAELAAAWRERGYELGFGVGIAVGHATLGRIGFDGRHDYGAIGNVTILASRLSSQAQAGQILLSPRAQQILEELVESEPIGELTLKGLARPSSPATSWQSASRPQPSATSALDRALLIPRVIGPAKGRPLDLLRRFTRRLGRREGARAPCPETQAPWSYHSQAG